MKQLIPPVLIALTMMLVSGQPAVSQSGGAQEVRGTVQGIVKNAISGEGIPEITVALVGVAMTPGATQMETTSDASGRFSFANIPRGPTTISTLGSIVTVPVMVDSTEHRNR